MMRDTVSDMRKHLWPNEKPDIDQLTEKIEKKANAKIDILKKTMSQEVMRILQQSDQNIASIEKEMDQLLERAIKNSREAEIEAREETTRESVFRVHRDLGRHQSTVSARDIVEALKSDIPPHRVVSELNKLKKEGIVIFESERVGPKSIILIRNQNRIDEDDEIPESPRE